METIDKNNLLNKLKEELDKHEDPYDGLGGYDDEEYETIGYRSGLIFCIDLIEKEKDD